MNVLIIPEDFRKDQYILKPLFTRLFRRLIGRSVQVDICVDPLLGGVTEALKSERITEILEANRNMYDLYILISSALTGMAWSAGVKDLTALRPK